ncbi:MAG: hypothetical protein ACR2PO_21180 [Methyloligellaceae bacterium]
MFSFSMRSIVSEVEAKLRAPDAGPGRGKAERKAYKDGGEQLKIMMRQLDLPNHARVDIFLDGSPIGSGAISNGGCVLKLRSEDCQDVPQIMAGQTMDILHGGQVLLSGVFRPD